jgi:hypothetical protein
MQEARSNLPSSFSPCITRVNVFPGRIKELSEAIWALEKAREEAVQEGARFIKG